MKFSCRLCLRAGAALAVIAGWVPAVFAQAAAPAPTAPASDAATEMRAHQVSPEEKKRGPKQFLLGVLWDVGLPLGPSRDFVRKVDPAGLTVSGRLRRLVSLPHSRLGLAFDIAWNNLEEKTGASIEMGNVTITGTQIRELSVSPLVVKPFFALGELEDVSPYVGVGVGVAYVQQRLDLGIYRYFDESWQFVVQPELGVEVPIGPLHGLAALRLNYLARSPEGSEQMYMTFSVGLGF